MNRVRTLLAAASLAVLLMSGLLTTSASAASLKADYTFDAGLVSSVPGAPNLTTINPAGSIVQGTVNGAPDNLFSFTAGSGLAFDPTGVIDRASYSVVVQFAFDANSSFRRILSFNTYDSNDDSGLYSYNGALDFYDTNTDETAGPPGVLANNVYSEVGFTRSAEGSVAAYEDGIPQLVHADAFGEGVISVDGLRFFKDNDNGENSGGTVARIRIYDGALTAEEVADINLVGGLRPSATGSGKVRSHGQGKRRVVDTGVRLKCPDEGVACPIKVILSTKPKPGQMRGRKLGAFNGAIGSGADEKIEIEPSSRGRRLLDKRGKTAVQIDAGITAGSGAVDAARNAGRI